MWEFHDAHLLLCSSSFAFSSCHWSYFITSLLTPTSQMATKPALSRAPQPARKTPLSQASQSAICLHPSKADDKVSILPNKQTHNGDTPTQTHTAFAVVISISMCVLREEMTTWKLSQLLFSPAVDRNKHRVEWKCEGMRTTRGW